VDDEQAAAGAQVRGRLGEDAVEQRAAVGASLPCAAQAAARQLVIRRRHVGRIGDDRVELLAGHGLEQAAAQRPHAHAVEARVEPHGQQRAA
jgi:hypothetical protein